MAAAARRIFQLFVESNYKGFDRVLQKVHIISAGNGSCVCELTVDEEHLNVNGYLHGGFTATLVDNFTTMAILTAEKPPGVSTDLSVSYMKAVKAGTVVTIDAKLVRAGKILAFAIADIVNKDTGEVVAQGRQTKFIG